MLKKFSLIILVLFIFANTALAKSDEYVIYHYTKGYLELYKGEFKQAAIDLWDVFPFVKSQEFYQELVDVLVYTGRYKQAQDVLERAIKLYPKNKEFYYKLFDVYTIEGMNREALKVMKLIQHRFEMGLKSMKKMAAMYIKSGHYNKALAVLNRCLKLNRKDPTIYYIKAQVCLKLNKINCALSNAEQAYRLNPHQYQYLILLAGLYEETGKLEKAIGLYKKLPSNATVFFVIANDYYRLGNLKEAINYYRKAFISSGRIDYLERLCYALVANGSYEEIIKLAKDYSKLFEQSDRLKLVYGIALSETNRCKQAKGVFKSINPAVTFYEDVAINESECLCREGKVNQIKELLNKYSDLKGYLYVISRFCIKNKRYKDALMLFSSALSKAKNNEEKARVYFYEADLYYSNLKDKRKAIDLLKKSISLYPDYAEALNYLGYMYIDENINVEKGIDLVKRALKIDKNNPYYLDSLGWGYFKLKKYKEAELNLKKAIELYKNDKKAMEVSYEHLLELYLKEGDKGKARSVAEELIKLNPDNKKARHVLNIK